MQFKQTLARLFFLLIPFVAISQTTYIPFGARENNLIERLEIKSATDSVLSFSKTKPYSRIQMIPRIGRLDSSLFTKVDEYNLRLAMMSNLEWAVGQRSDYVSKKPIWKSFYETPANLYEVYKENFFLAINPVIQYTLSKESDNDQHLFLNARGVTLRGRIADKVGFAASIT